MMISETRATKYMIYDRLQHVRWYIEVAVNFACRSLDGVSKLLSDDAGVVDASSPQLTLSPNVDNVLASIYCPSANPVILVDGIKYCSHGGRR